MKNRGRSIRLLRRAGQAPGVFRLTSKNETVFYVFREIPCEIGGRGFAVHRLGLSNLYHLRIGTVQECSCECLGFLRHGYCKHVLGLLALREKGWLG